MGTIPRHRQRQTVTSQPLAELTMTQPLEFIAPGDEQFACVYCGLEATQEQYIAQKCTGCGREYGKDDQTDRFIFDKKDIKPQVKTNYEDVVEKHKIKSIIDRITKVVKSQTKQDAHYTLHFNDGVQITLTADQLVNSREFLKTYIATYDYRPSLDPKLWGKFINRVLQKTVERARGFSDEENTISIVTASLHHLKLYKTLDKNLLEDWSCAYLETKTKTLYVRSETMRKILDSERIKLSLRELHEMAKPYLSGTSVQLRVGTERHSFWKFSSEKLGIKNEAIEAGDDNA